MKLTRFQWIVIGILLILTIAVIAIGGFVLTQFSQPQLTEALTSKLITTSEPARVTLPPTWTPPSQQKLPLEWTPTSEILPSLATKILSTQQLNYLADSAIWSPTTELPAGISIDMAGTSGLKETASRAWINRAGALFLIHLFYFSDKEAAERVFWDLNELDINGREILLPSDAPQHPGTISKCFVDNSKSPYPFVCNLQYNKAVITALLISHDYVASGWGIPLTYGVAQAIVLDDAGY